jgi:TonB family protein
MLSRNLAKRLLLITLLILSLLAGGIAQNRQERWPCGEYPKLLRDKRGMPLWFKSTQLKKRAINQIAPKLPSSVRVQGTIIVEVLVDTDGQVKCVRARKGHPILRRATEEAARQWTFKPILVKGEPVTVFGSLSFYFSN